MKQYFQVTFFKGQILHKKVLEAEDETSARKYFKQKYSSRNLLEIVLLNQLPK